MHIRPYTPQDWPRVCAIHDAARRDELAAAGLDAAYLTLEQTAETEGLLDYQIRVALLPPQAGGDHADDTDDAARAVAGFVAFSEDELAWLYVDPALYGRGVGRGLIRAVLAETQRPFTAEVLEGNEAALAVYLKTGFEIVGRAQGRMPGNEGFAVSVLELRHPGLA